MKPDTKIAIDYMLYTHDVCLILSTLTETIGDHIANVEDVSLLEKADSLIKECYILLFQLIPNDNLENQTH
jgi:hypothetical protein